MWNKQRIKAFTLSEMLVVLAITTIVVGLAFVILNLVNKQVNLIETNYNTRQETDKLETALWIDFNSFENVYYHQENNRLSFKGSKNTNVYVFTPEYSLRNRDSLVGGFQVKVFFLGKEIQNGTIDAVQLSLNNRELFVFKNSDASFYMND